MKKIFKRFLSITLASALMITMLPSNIKASEGEKYFNFEVGKLMVDTSNGWMVPYGSSFDPENLVTDVTDQDGNALTYGEDYEVIYPSTEIGTDYILTVSGINAYEGIESTMLYDVKIPLDNLSYEFKGSEKVDNTYLLDADIDYDVIVKGTYNGKEVTLSKEDCSFSPLKDIEKTIGDHDVYVVPGGDSDYVWKSFTVKTSVRHFLDNAYTEVESSLYKEGVTLKDMAAVPVVTLSNGTELVAGKDFDYTVSGDGTPDSKITYEIVAKDTSKFYGSKTIDSQILDNDISNSSYDMDIILVQDGMETSNLLYTGNVIDFGTEIIFSKGDYSVVLTEGKDFTVNVKENKEVKECGEYTLVITGIGDYIGSVEKTIKVRPETIDLSDATVSLSWTSKVYNASVQKPEVTVTLEDGTIVDNELLNISIPKSNNAGTYKVTVKGIEDNGYIGEATSSYTISKAKISKVTLAATSYTYDGKIKTPSVTVVADNGKTLANKITKSNSNVILSYASGRKNVGSYSVKVTPKDTKNYEGSKSVTFKINPVKTSISAGYPSNNGYNSVKLKWSKKSTQVTGYQIQWSTKSDFSSNCHSTTVSSYKTTSKNITGFDSSSQTIYFRIRTYKTVNGTKYYSAWSAKKSKKTVASSLSNFKVAQSGNNIKVSWSKRSDATGYKVYRAESKSGSYKCIKTISKNSTTSYTDSSVKEGKVYYYKVRAYKTKSGNTYYGKYTTATGKMAGKMSGFKASVTTDSITASWSKNSNVDGYQVQWSKKSDFSTKSSTTISTNTTTSYKITGLSERTTYYIRVRGYKKADGTTYYSAWNSISAKTKSVGFNAEDYMYQKNGRWYMYYDKIIAAAEEDCKKELEAKNGGKVKVIIETKKGNRSYGSCDGLSKSDGYSDYDDTLDEAAQLYKDVKESMNHYYNIRVKEYHNNFYYGYINYDISGNRLLFFEEFYAAD